MIVLATGREWHSHHGAIQHDDLIGRSEGVHVRTTGGSSLLVLRPTLSDYILKMKRGAQVIYPKDIGLILVHADIRAGMKVIEAGTGSGSLTLALAGAVGESGSVISYEVRDDHHERAVQNIDDWYSGTGGKPANVELRIGDIFEGVPETNVDRLVLDLPEPWHAVGATTASLAAGGIICSYVPTVPQVIRTVEALRGGGFGLIGTFEGLVRTWNVDGPSVRPDHRMVAHTGFITIARKLSTD